jgi:putative transposase
MKRFASPRQAQRFLSAFSGITPHFRLRRHLLTASEWRREIADRFAAWNEITGLSAAASTVRLRIPSPDPHAAIRLGPS